MMLTFPRHQHLAPGRSRSLAAVLCLFLLPSGHHQALAYTWGSDTVYCSNITDDMSSTTFEVCAVDSGSGPSPGTICHGEGNCTTIYMGGYGHSFHIVAPGSYAAGDQIIPYYSHPLSVHTYLSDDGSCKVSVDLQDCSSCTACDDDGNAFSADCTNLPNGRLVTCEPTCEPGDIFFPLTKAALYGTVTASPSASPSWDPPSGVPSASPSSGPPSGVPSASPSSAPSASPSSGPPSGVPSASPSSAPSASPSSAPSAIPSSGLVNTAMPVAPGTAMPVAPGTAMPVDGADVVDDNNNTTDVAVGAAEEEPSNKNDNSGSTHRSSSVWVVVASTVLVSGALVQQLVML